MYAPPALGVLTFATGWLGVDQVTSSGTDFAGLALLVTAVSGLIATVGSIVIALRRRPARADDLAVRLLAKQMGLDPDHLDEP